jgi:hypothetical protein
MLADLAAHPVPFQHNGRGLTPHATARRRPGSCGSSVADMTSISCAPAHPAGQQEAELIQTHFERDRFRVW